MEHILHPVTVLKVELYNILITENGYKPDAPTYRERAHDER